MSDDNASAPAGWYPQPDGSQRYWDGAAWTSHVSAGAVGDDKALAVLAHVLNVVATVIGPLVIYLVKRDESVFVRSHATEALNFGITLLIAYVVAAVTSILLVGVLLFPVIIVLQIVFTIMAGLAAGRGEVYRYPLNIRFVS
jgi:uncharacterized protein